MNVRRAKEVFSSEVIGAISTLKENIGMHPEAYTFMDAEATIFF